MIYLVVTWRPATEQEKEGGLIPTVEEVLFHKPELRTWVNHQRTDERSVLNRMVLDVGNVKRATEFGILAFTFLRGYGEHIDANIELEMAPDSETPENLMQQLSDLVNDYAKLHENVRLRDENQELKNEVQQLKATIMRLDEDRVALVLPQ